MKTPAEGITTGTPREAGTPQPRTGRMGALVIRIAVLIATLALVVIAYETVQIASYQRQQRCYADIATHASVASQNGGQPRDVGINNGTPTKCRLVR